MTNEIRKIGQKLKEEKDTILRDWEKLVREKVKGAQGEDSVAIKNTIPTLIEKMAETLEKAPPKFSDNLEKELEIAKEHGEQRSKLEKYSVEQIVYEYQLLRYVVLKNLESDRVLDPKDRDVVLDAISYAERKATTEFSRIKHNLEAGIRERTRERDREKEEHQRTRGQVGNLEEEREIRARFVATLTHDLRTPITAAKMNMQLLLRKKEDPAAADKHAGRAIDNLNRLDAMIQDLLDANRISAGEKLPVKPQEMSLGACLRDTLDELTAIHGERFDLKVEGDIRVFWDGNAIRRAVENLCQNAAKYGYAGTPITISVSETDKETVRVSVHNQGPLIPLETREKLFQPFRRSESAEKTREGWGIGLTLVKGVAEAHGGQVTMESSGDGSTFTMILPKVARQEPARKSA